jgi:hypothetical protein
MGSVAWERGTLRRLDNAWRVLALTSDMLAQTPVGFSASTWWLKATACL